jgi:hypothetical protein
MTRTPCLTDLRKSSSSPTTAGNAGGQRSARLHQQPMTAISCRRRINRVTLGFWVGGAISAAGGCLFAASMPYQYAVGVTVSVLWWGIYCGCTGASLSALCCRLAERILASPPQKSDGAGKPTSGADSPAFPAGSSGSLSGTSRR